MPLSGTGWNLRNSGISCPCRKASAAMQVMNRYGLVPAAPKPAPQAAETHS